jgi:hypothetical protein
MDYTTEEALHHLLWIFRQWANFEHRNMTAGEEATDFLVSLGLGEDDGYSFVPNDEAKRIMDKYCQE